MGINLFSFNWWVNQFVTVFITMIFIYIIKSASQKFQIPVVSTIVENV